MPSKYHDHYNSLIAGTSFDRSIHDKSRKQEVWHSESWTRLDATQYMGSHDRIRDCPPATSTTLTQSSTYWVMTLLGMRNLESKGDTKFITQVSTSKSPPLRPRYELRLVYGIFQTARHLAS